MSNKRGVSGGFWRRNEGGWISKPAKNCPVCTKRRWRRRRKRSPQTDPRVCIHCTRYLVRRSVVWFWPCTSTPGQFMRVSNLTCLLPVYSLPVFLRSAGATTHSTVTVQLQCSWSTIPVPATVIIADSSDSDLEAPRHSHTNAAPRPPFPGASHPAILPTSDCQAIKAQAVLSLSLPNFARPSSFTDQHAPSVVNGAICREHPCLSSGWPHNDPPLQLSMHQLHSAWLLAFGAPPWAVTKAQLDLNGESPSFKIIRVILLTSIAISMPSFNFCALTRSCLHPCTLQHPSLGRTYPPVVTQCHASGTRLYWYK